MMVTRSDQSLILMGLSGSGKTFNARYLLRYLATIGQPDNGPVTSERARMCTLLWTITSKGDFLSKLCCHKKREEERLELYLYLRVVETLDEEF